MFNTIKPMIYTAKTNSDEVALFQNNEVIKLLSGAFPGFQIGFVPENYDIAFMMMKEDLEDSFKDEWKIAYFKKTLASPTGTITLDNMDDLDKSVEEYEIYKTLDGSFEDVITISCELISKHKQNILDMQKEDEEDSPEE